jgi:cobalt-zinc-cadmium efflux system outer membrane protein
MRRDKKLLRPLRSLLLIGLPILLAGACATPPRPHWKARSAADFNHPLTLEECLRLARENDVKQAEWKARLAGARAALTTAKIPPNPTFQPLWDETGIKDALGKSVAITTYGFSYPVFFWWTRLKEIAVARQRLKGEEAGVARDQRQLASEIGTAYFKLAAAQHKVRISVLLLQNAKESLRLSEETQRVGSASGQDVKLAQAEAQQAEADLDDVRQEERMQGLAFAFAMGADRPIPIQVKETEMKEPTFFQGNEKTTSTLPQSLLSKALQTDPAYAKARAAQKEAEASLELEYRKIVPLSETQVIAGPERAPEGLGASLSFSAPIPLFNWNQGGIKRAQAELLAARTEEEKARREVVARMSDFWETYRMARQRFQTYAQPLAVSRARLAKGAQELFAAGQMSYPDLLQMWRQWQQAELAAVDFWRESMTAGWNIFCEIDVGQK